MNIIIKRLAFAYLISVNFSYATNVLGHSANELIPAISALYYILMLITCICCVSMIIEYLCKTASSYVAQVSYTLALTIYAFSNSICIALIYIIKFIYTDSVLSIIKKHTLYATIQPIYSDKVKLCLIILSDICAYLTIYQFVTSLLISLIYATRIDLFAKVITVLLICKVLILKDILSYIITISHPSLYISAINSIILFFIGLIILEVIFLSRRVISLRVLRHNLKYLYLCISGIFTGLYAFYTQKYEMVVIIKIAPLWLVPQMILYIQNRIQQSIFRYVRIRYIMKESAKMQQTRMNLIKFALIINKIMQIITIIIISSIGLYILDTDFMLSSIIDLRHLCRALYLILIVGLYYTMQFIIEYAFTKNAEENIAQMPFDTQRIQTFTHLSKTFFKTLMLIICILVTLSIFGVNIAPFFQSIGLFSAAISLSIQQFIRDFLNGILILYDRSIQLNDIIEIDGKTSIVEDMSLRYIRVRYDDGTLCTIPFHQINTIRNRNRQYTASILNITIEGDIPLEKTEAAVREAFMILKDQIEMRRIVRSIEFRDIVDFTATSYIMQVKITATQNNHNKVKRAFMRVLRQVFNERGVSIAKPSGPNIATLPSASTLSPYTDFE